MANDGRRSQTQARRHNHRNLYTHGNGWLGKQRRRREVANPRNKARFKRPCAQTRREAAQAKVERSKFGQSGWRWKFLDLKIHMVELIRQMSALPLQQCHVLLCQLLPSSLGFHGRCRGRRRAQSIRIYRPPPRETVPGRRADAGSSQNRVNARNAVHLHMHARSKSERSGVGVSQSHATRQR